MATTAADGALAVITGTEPALIPSARMRQVEEAFLATWPALDQKTLGSWRLGAAEGVTGRSNSVTVLGDDDLDGKALSERLDAVEAFYAARALASVVRVTALTPPALIDALRARGYRPEDASRVLVGTLPADRIRLEEARAKGWVIEDEAGEPFFSAADGTGSRTSGHRRVLEALLAKVGGAKAFISRHDEKGPLAGAYVAVHGAMLTLYNVATAERARRTGLASQMMRIAAGFGADAGADTLFLFVAAGNDPALTLYRRFGASQVYTYAYWRKEAGA
ncbi:MAG: GNAT family N-acetyltransferase [Hyphomicrobiaceae bacterium]|nr:GNAT family N-acetyltransferase [Hyphomicrobiaceae bacterium]